MEKPSKSCLVCSSKTKFFSKNKNYQIYKCINCGFGFTDSPRIQQNDYHRDDTYISAEKLFKNIFLKRVEMISKFLKPSQVLEVGCSTGLMLSLLRKMGWQVIGVEISKKAANIAKERGIEVIESDFLKVRLEKKFDLVIFNHTLEHLQDPIEVLKKAKLTLKPKGILYIDLPNFGGFSARILKGKWPLLLPDEHLWHFNLKSLSILLKKMGFKILKVERASGIWDVASPFSEVLLSLVTFKKRFFSNIITALPALILTKLGWGTGLTIISRKR